MRLEWILIVCAAVTLTLPGILFGASGLDLFTNAAWAKQFAEVLAAGEWYPRWLPDNFGGFGSPVFFLYPPLAFFMAAPFSFLHSLDALGFYPLLASVFVGMCIAGWTSYAWLRGEVNRESALFGALLYVAMPFFVTQSFYALSLMGQFWAYVWFPLVFLGASRIARGLPYGVIISAASVAILALSNIPNFIIVCPFAMLYAVVFAPSEQKFRAMRDVAAVTVLGIALAAIYLMPAIHFGPYTLTQYQWIPESDQSYVGRLLHWENFGNGISPRNYFYVQVLVTTSVLLLVLSGFVFFTRAASEVRRKTLFWLAVGLYALFMNLWPSRYIWNSFQVFLVVQMPSRYLGLAGIACVILASYLLHYRKEPIFRTLAATGFLIFVSFAFYLSHDKRIDHDTLLAQPESSRTKRYVQLYYNRYLNGIDQNFAYLTSAETTQQFYDDAAFAKLNRDPFEVLSGNATIEIKEWKSRHLLLSVTATKPSLIALRQFAFPAWSAHLAEDAMVFYPLLRDRPTGRMVLKLPENFGTHDVVITLEELPMEILGRLISVLAAISLLMGLLWRFRKEERKRLIYRS